MDSLTVFAGSIPAPSQVNGNQIIWNLPASNYDSVSFNVQVLFIADSSLSIGDTIHFSSFITPISGDVNASNNSLYLDYQVTGSQIAGNDQLLYAYPPGKCDERFIELTDRLVYK
jgi:hypothetical protein